MTFTVERTKVGTRYKKHDNLTQKGAIKMGRKKRVTTVDLSH